MSHLIKRYTNYDMTHLSDALSCIAANIENAYIQSGAVAGKDYTYNDLMNLAMKFVSGSELGNTFHTDTTIAGKQ
ncbi:hypothetical protein NOI88_20270 [Escherichia coli]|uniref:hypothetical protein n=1 Tax=Escherichia coli TaxID=562 RepID=UPI002874619A|nr:hypothetical protein [Escherichia coli]MED8730370.1 hypothetical protein [Escherichia marmotae]EFO1585572.1 hypothetical protein [Escherichia coli]EIN2316389.1 hypothetical protein [Escherichia coli]MDS0560199.1 hypothetical protein [Escherichia coli]MDS0571781.1 hypothetical protein [Escherichia coli]